MRVGEQEQDRSQAVGCDVGGDIHHRSLIYCFLEGSYQVQSALRGDGGQGAVPGGYAMSAWSWTGRTLLWIQVISRGPPSLTSTMAQHGLAGLTDGNNPQRPSSVAWIPRGP